MLALPLLWASLDDEMEAYMPARARNRIRAAYETTIRQQLEPEVNPVKKILYVVTGFEVEVHIDEINEMDLDGGNDGARQAGLGRTTLILEPFTLNTLQCEDNSRSSEPNCSNITRERLGTMINSTILFGGSQSSLRAVQRITTTTRRPPKMKSGMPLCRARPVISIRFGTSLGPGAERPLSCSQLRKGAKSDGQVKYTYHRRKVVWNRIALMIRACHTAQIAIDSTIYQVYEANRSATQIYTDHHSNAIR